MRRISRAIALLGAVAAAGCSGTGAPGTSGTARGTPGSTYTIQVRGDATWTDGGVSTNRPRGGTVTSTPAGLSCGDAGTACSFDVAWGTTVTLAVTYGGASTVHAFAGDCSGAACQLTGNSDKLVLVRFAASAAGLGGHPNFSDAAVHGPAYVAFMKGDTGALDCRSCHGAELTGQGLAVSCASCHAWPPPHDAARFQARFDPYLAVSLTGPAVTAICNGCHVRDAEAFMATQHWQWKGPTPQMYDVGADWLASIGLKNTGTYGKANLINNFCVSTAGNEKRCDQCHAGYGTGPSGTTSNDSAHVRAAYQADPNRVDCLICHSKSVNGAMAAGGYNKIAGAYGAAGYATGPGAPLPSSAQMRSWATNLQRPTRENCGWCHFNGGGADSVKIMSTALRTPDASVDVHMSPARGNLSCATCHADADHKVKGAGVGTPNNFARTSCESCHGTRPHGDLANHGSLDGHTATVACQTCHIPAFARGKAMKTDWDWSTAGYKNIVAGGTIYACAPLAGGAMVPYGAGCATGYEKVKAYDYMKGTFAWGANVKPTYAWYNGKMTHATTDDKGVFGALGTTKDNRITLSQPLGSRADPTAKIYPFKVMTGRQLVYVDDAAGSSFIVSPKLFMQVGGDGGFWGTISAQAPGTVHGYTYTPATGEGLDAFGAPSLPLDGSFVVTTNINGYTAYQSYPFSQLLGQVVTLGAKAAGQIDAASPTLTKYAGASGWDWRYTQMYLDLEHEVAPKEQALGYNHGCSACHQPYNPTAQVTTPTPFMEAVGYDADPGYVTTARRTP